MLVSRLKVTPVSPRSLWGTHPISPSFPLYVFNTCFILEPSIYLFACLFISGSTHGYLFTTLAYSPMWLYLLCCSFVPVWARGNFQLALASLWHNIFTCLLACLFMSISSLSGTTKCSRPSVHTSSHSVESAMPPRSPGLCHRAPFGTAVWKSDVLVAPGVLLPLDSVN